MPNKRYKPKMNPFETSILFTLDNPRVIGRFKGDLGDNGLSFLRLMVNSGIVSKERAKKVIEEYRKGGGDSGFF